MLNLPERAYIYGLYDPRCPDVIWYVGKTNNPYNRLQYYRKDPSNTPIYRWFRRTQSEGFEPQLRILEECSFSKWQEREKFFIALYRKKNLLLLNKLSGGDGTAVKGRKDICEICGTPRAQLYPSDTSLRCPNCRTQQRSEYMQNWHEKNPDYNSIYSKAYYQENRETFLDRAKAYRENNPEHKKQVDREYYLRNCEKIKKRSAARHERIRLQKAAVQ